MTQKVVQVTLDFSLFRHIFYNSYGVYLSGKKKVGDLVFSTDSFSLCNRNRSCTQYYGQNMIQSWRKIDKSRSESKSDMNSGRTCSQSTNKTLKLKVKRRLLLNQNTTTALWSEHDMENNFVKIENWKGYWT